MSSSFLKSFGVNAMTRLKRTKFSKHDQRILTLAPGWLVPIYCKDVIPSDVWNMKEVDVSVKQLLQSLRPTFGDVYLSMYFFFVPYRILWKKWTEIFGDGKPSEWDKPVETVLPLHNFYAGHSSSDVSTKSTTGGGYDGVVNTCCGVSQSDVDVISKKYNLADYLGFALTELDTSNVTIPINILHFIAYEKIWTDNFRDENVQEPDPDVEKYYNYSGSGNLDLRLSLHYANKLKDVYTTSLPAPQKGEPVTIALGESAPIYISNDETETLNIAADQKFQFNSNETLEPGESGSVMLAATTGAGTYAGAANVYVDLSRAVGAKVTEVRFDFALQKMKERDARGGTRYPEILLSTFESYNGDMTLQRPEMLGGETVKLNMTTVPSTGDSAAGKLGGMSNTNFSSHPFVKTFGEFGVLMGVATIRPRNMYCQGVPKFARKYRRYDFFEPLLQHTGDQPLYTSEIYAFAGKDDVFGFQECYYEYVMDENIVCADMRGGTTDMNAWAYVENFASEPYLNSAFKVQTGKAITKTLVGYSNDYPGYVYGMSIDFFHEVTSPKDPHSIPGLIDH